MEVSNKKIGFGTLPVYLTTVTTILGAVLFLRFGYAAAHVGFWGLIGLIVIGHIVTVPTAMAIAEIATNQRVEGGGAYYIISRSFGLNIGGAVGVALFLSQAISVSFYVIAFAEAFNPVFDFVNQKFGTNFHDVRIISIPVMILLSFLIISRGANMGMKALYVVAVILFISLFLFFIGSPIDPDYVPNLRETVSKPDDFFYVFIIIFPAFTGLIAGLGLSGDLKNPKKSIPLGVISATFTGIVVYIFAAYKLTACASPEQLANDQLIMSKIAVWGPIIPIGLAAAAISSALGSIMVAPRTLQAIGADNIFKLPQINKWIARGKIATNEPRNASLFTIIIAFFFVSIGSINFIAEIISMFFIITYGAICAISFLEHFAADPAYRPSFKSKWQFSLIGAILSFWLMFKMNLPYAILSLVSIISIYSLISYYHQDRSGVANIFQGFIFQTTRKLRIFLQKSDNKGVSSSWRPSVVCITSDSFKRFSAFELLKWFSYKYGFGVHIHYIKGYLSKQSNKESKTVREKLIKLAEASKSNVYIDTLISPSITSAIAQVIQLPSVSGKENNMIMFEFDKKEPENIEYIIDNFQLIKSIDFDVCILGSSSKEFGYKSEIHIWITAKDYNNANLMILLGYIILGHKDWKDAEIKIFAVYPIEGIENARDKMFELIKSGHLPISHSNINIISQKENESIQSIICKNSEGSDLTIVGFKEEQIKKLGKEIFIGYDNIGNILFVNTTNKMKIAKD